MFPLLSSLFVTLLVVSNIIAVKIGSFWGVFLPTAVIVFPITYILGDVITEVYGYATMRKTIWTGFVCNLLAVCAFAAAQSIPAAPFFDAQDAFARIVGATPRILGASFVAYLIGGFSNAFVMSKMKVLTKGKNLWMRTISSTVIGEALDSTIFITLAFAGSMPNNQLMTLVFMQWAAKVIFEVLATPVTYALTGYLKAREKSDVYDTQTNFNPLQF